MKQNIFNKKMIHLVLCSLLSSQHVWSQSILNNQTNDKSFINEKLNENRWFKKNSGQQVEYDLNPLFTYTFQGRSGYDIHPLDIKKIPSPVVLKKIKVAVIDTGVDTDHPYLKTRLVQNKSEEKLYRQFKECVDGGASLKECSEKLLNTENEKRDQNGNDYPADMYGWNLLDADLLPGQIHGHPLVSDSIGHGTHVAGVITQVSDYAEIIPIQVVGDRVNEPIKPFSIDLSADESVRGGIKETRNLSERVSRAIIYAYNAGAQVINLSIGWPEVADSEDLKNAIQTVIENGVIVVAAAGNDSTNALLRPCQYKGVICVGATRPDGTLAHFSNYGYGVDIAAPGVSIASIIPMSHRSIRFPPFNGVDLLSGTSQATPIISGVIANLLAAGVSADEIYPRLMLSAKPLAETELDILQGSQKNNAQKIKLNTQSKYRRYVLSGLVDESKSLEVTPQPYIVTADKNINLIYWDRKSSDLSFKLKLKNMWKDVDLSQIKVSLSYSDYSFTLEDKTNGKMSRLLKSKILPQIKSAQLNYETSDEQGNELATSWVQNQELTFPVELKLTDLNPEFSQISSDLAFKIKVEYLYQNKKMIQEFETKAEIVVPLDKNVLGSDMKELSLLNLPVIKDPKDKNKAISADSLKLIDEVFDKNQNERDYFSIKRNDNDFTIRLIKSNSLQSSYKVGEAKTISFDGQLKQTRISRRMRLDVDFDGQSEYVLAIKEYKLDEEENRTQDYNMHLYIFDDEMNVKEVIKYTDERAVMPEGQFYWVKVIDKNNKPHLKPAWVGSGYPVKTKLTQFELNKLNSENDKMASGQFTIRFYYLNSSNKLAEFKPFTYKAGEVSMDKAGDVNELHRIVDVISPSIEQVQSGVLPVLVAENQGTLMQPSYVNKFYLGYINSNLQSPNTLELKTSKIDLFENGTKKYRNLTNTKVDRILNSSSGDNEFRGTFWFGQENYDTQRVTLINFVTDAANSDAQSKKMVLTDYYIKSTNSVLDSALLVRAAFAGNKNQAIYLITNNEIEYHDLTSGTSAMTSLNKYTFIGDDLTAVLQFPISITSRQSGEKYPALFTTEGSRLNYGVKMLVPVFASMGNNSQGGVKVEQLISPARLHIKAPEGCRATDTPVFLGGNDVYALDYYCGNKLLRQYLKY